MMRQLSRQPGRRSSGLTLIELLGALALLATLLTAMLAARGDAVRQAARAGRKLIAIDYADELLTTWWASVAAATDTDRRSASADAFPRQDQGRSERLALRWRTAVMDSPPFAALGGQVVRLRVWDERAAASASSEPLVQVDVVLPLPLQVSDQDIDSEAP